MPMCVDELVPDKPVSWWPPNEDADPELVPGGMPRLTIIFFQS